MIPPPPKKKILPTQALLRQGYHGQSHNSLAVVLGLGVAKQIPEAARALGMQQPPRRAAVRRGLIRLPELDRKVLSFLKLSGGGADTNKPVHINRRTPLIAASRNGHENVVRMLIMAGADKDMFELSTGMTALHWAAYNGHLDVVRELMVAGADFNIVSALGYTAEELIG